MAEKAKREPKDDGHYSREQIRYILNGYCPYCPTLTMMKATQEEAAGGPTQTCSKCNWQAHGMPSIRGI